MPDPYGLPLPADDVAPRGTKAWRMAVDARRRAVADQAWRAQAMGRLDLSDQGQMSDFLAGLGITSEIGGGRHMRRLFLGDLPSEGWGQSPVAGRGGMSMALEQYIPAWRQGLDRAIQGGHLTRDRSGMYFNPGKGGAMQWYDAFGSPAQAPATAAPMGANPMGGSLANPMGNPTSLGNSPAMTEEERRRYGLS